MEIKELKYDCPQVSWYHLNRCTVTSCKNWTAITKSHCIEIDRVRPEGGKIISDAEIQLFKYSDADITLRLVSMKRKKAIQKVQALIVLYKYIEFIKDTCIIVPDSSRQEKKLLKRYPLKIKELGYMSGMLIHLTNIRLFQQFLKRKDGECKEIPIYRLFNMTPLKYDKLLMKLGVDNA